MLAPLPPSDGTRHAQHSRLILIEDDESVRRSMTMLMRARGYQVDAFRSGAEFLTMRGRHGGHCLLIDYKMPRMDGLEVLRRLRSNEDQTPAIMITGFYSNSLHQRALEAGFKNVIEKPAPPEQLLAKIGEAVSQQRGFSTEWDGEDE